MRSSQHDDGTRAPNDALALLRHWLTALCMALAIQYLPALALAPAFVAATLTVARSIWWQSFARMPAALLPQSV
jgi:hypothetical protein